LPSTIDGGEWSAVHLCRFITGVRGRVPMKYEIGWTSKLGLDVLDEITCFSQDSNLNPVARSLVTVPNKLSLLLILNVAFWKGCGCV
jgi:hypothetical protein